MVRKACLLSWMTIWPIVALFPALVAGPATKLPQADTNVAITLAQNLSEERQAPVEITENLPEIRNTDAPQLSVPASTASASPELGGTEPSDNAHQPVSVPADRPESASKPTTLEALPPVSSRTTESVPPTTAAPRAIHRTGLPPTAQLERAQKLIHERAQLRAQQRHARLEIKYRRPSGFVPVTPVARWHAQLLHPNWVAGSARKP